MAVALREFTPVMTSRFPNIVDVNFGQDMKEIAKDLKVFVLLCCCSLMTAVDNYHNLLILLRLWY
jgi:hypothetical protein